MEIPDDNDFEDELEAEEQEVEEEKKEKVEAKAKKPAAKTTAKAEGAIKERYAAIHQPERIVIVDNVAGVIVADEFKDLGSAMVSAMILNGQDKILTSLGA